MAEITGTSGADILQGTEEDDIIFALAGDDIIDGAGGDDLIQGQEGDDLVEGGDGDDLLLGDEGNDVAIGGAGNDILSGGAGDDDLEGGEGSDLAAYSSPATYIEAGVSANVFEIVAVDGGFEVDVVDAAVGGELSSTLPDFFEVTDSGDDDLSGVETLRFGNNVDLDLTAEGLDLADIAPELVNATFDPTQTDGGELGLTIVPGETIAIASSDLVVIDPDTAPSDIVYTVTALPQTGTLSLDGTALAEGDTFAQADIDSGLLAYAAPVNAPVGEFDRFQFSVASGAYAIALDAVGETPTFTFEFAESEPINVPPEFLGAPFEFSVAENSAAGTLVGTLEAQDADSDPLTYAVIGGNDDIDGDGTAAFAINANTGEITVADSDDLDFETQNTFSLTATVSDGVFDPVETAVTVNLTDSAGSRLIITTPIADIAATPESPNREIPLFETFDDTFTTGLVARFELFNTDLGENGGVTEVVLFDQAGTGAPGTVANFRNYVEDGDYVNSIVHRSIPGFVVQGGGFIADGLDEIVDQDGNPADAVSLVPTDPPIANEFSPTRSNLPGTIAMAKLGNDPDSATSQWFFNLSDNASNLDNQNGGFTVFGEVRSPADFGTVEAIAALPTPDGADTLFGQSAFTELPFIDTIPETPEPEITGDANFVRYSNISVFSAPELSFEVVGNSNPDVVNASIEGDRLVLDYADDATGTTEISVRATNLLGETVDETFSVSVSDTPPETPTRLDVDGDGAATALNDGLIIFSFLAGLAPSVFESFLSDGATRTVDEIATFLDAELEEGGLLDIDASGEATAFNDGLILFRALGGLPAASFESAFSPDATRTPNEIAAFLADLLPPETPLTPAPENAPDIPEQVLIASDVNIAPGETAAITVSYEAIDPELAAAAGLNFSLFYDSTQLAFEELLETFDLGLQPVVPQPDSENLDNDPSTDTRLTFLYTDFIDSNWPFAEVSNQPVELFTANFATSNDFESSDVNLRLREVPPGFEATAATLGTEITVSTDPTSDEFFLDVDGDGAATAFNDGAIVFRFLGGLPASTFESALSDGATRSVEEIATLLADLIDAGILDIDGDGAATAFTDGLINFRFLGGLLPSTFESALSEGATRGVEEIDTFLSAIAPPEVILTPVAEDTPGIPSQRLSSAIAPGSVLEAGSTFGLSVRYEAIDGEQLVIQGADGLNFRLFFNSNDLTFIDFGEESFAFGANPLAGSEADTDDLDGDPTTDSFLTFLYQDPAFFSGQPVDWPFAASDEVALPLELFVANFAVADDFEETAVNLRLREVPAGFEATEATIVTETVLRAGDTPPDPLLAVENATFEIAADAEIGAIAGIVEVVGAAPDAELSFAIAAGNPDADEDGTSAFTIDPDTGEISLTDSDELEASSEFNLEVTATDESGQTGTGEIAIDVRADDPDIPEQAIDLVLSEAPSAPGETASVTVFYSTTDIEEAPAAGLSLRIHFNSTQLTFVEVTDVFSFGGQPVLLRAEGPDEDDGDPNTDTFATLQFVDFNNVPANWPFAEADEQPVELATLNFTTSNNFEATTVNATLGAVQFGFDNAPGELLSSIAVSDAPPEPEVSFDVDGNGVVDAGTDALLAARFLGGLPIAIAAEGFLASDATRTEEDDLQAVLNAEVNFGGLTGPLFDIDGNGVADAGTDALLLARFLGGLPIEVAAEGFLANDATRTSPDDLTAYIEAFLPG